MDVSYIHHNCSREEHSIYDSYDPLYRVERRPEKGNRYCIRATVQGTGNTQPE